MRPFPLISLAALSLAPALVLAATPPKILDPAPGAVVPQTFPVTVDVGTYNYCDTDGCFDQAFEGMSICADDESVAGDNPNSDEVTIEVTLEPGTYSLVAKGEAFVGASAQSDPISVTVETGTTGGDSTGESETGDSETGDTDGGGGSGCTLTGESGAVPPTVLALLVMLLGTRRREDDGAER